MTVNCPIDPSQSGLRGDNPALQIYKPACR